jgi:tetratricopeptide (TPR) repeat protein
MGSTPKRESISVLRGAPALVVSLMMLRLASPVTASAAEILHLKNGTRVVVDRYWEEGDQVFYERFGGTFGFPRRLLDRVERETGSSLSQEAASPPSPTPIQPGPLPPQTHEDRAMATALEEARAATRRGDHDGASRRYREALAARPDSVVARVELAEVYLSRGDLVSAQAQLEHARQLAPRDAVVRELLGDVYHRRGRAVLAIREWQKALEISPHATLLDKLKRALRENEEDIAFDEVRGARVTLRYDGAVNERIGREIAGALEDEYDELVREFRFRPPAPVRVVLYTNQEFFDVTRAPSWVSAINDGEIRIPVQGLPGLDDRVRRVLRHELTHSFVNARTANNCPTWFQEGLAQLRAGDEPADLYPRLREAREAGGLLPLWSLEGPFLSLSPDQARLAYHTSLAATRYLVERRGREGLLGIIDELARMNNMNAALKRVVGLDYQELQTAWEADLNRYRPDHR